MSTISNAQVFCGLTAIATPSKTGVSGSLTIAGGSSRVSLPLVDAAYALQAYIAKDGGFVLNAATGGLTATTWVAGAAQVTASLASGTITTAGNAFATVTAAGLSGSPLAVTVAVALSDTAALWAAKAVTALNADTAVAAMFTASATSATINLTRNPTHTIDTVNFYAATDSTLNLKLANGTCYGIATVTTSTSVVAGTVTSGAYAVDGDGKDFQGVSIAANTVHAVLAEVVDVLDDDDLNVTLNTGTLVMSSDESVLIYGNGTAAQEGQAVSTATAGNHAKMIVTVFGKAT